MSTSNTFQLKTVSRDEPLSDDPFYAWLQGFGKRNIPDNTIRAYLESLGFVVGRDYITEEQHKTLEYVADTFYRCEPETVETPKFFELFTTGGQASMFYVQGKEGKFCLSEKLINLLSTSGWIYEPHPDNTFFEVTEDGRLFAKYQQIIGSRFLCRLAKDPKITVQRRGWYDKVNGNTYFSCLVEIEGAESFVIPFQYGYGSQWQYEAREELIKRGIIADPGYYTNGNRKGGLSDIRDMVDWVDHGDGLKRDLYKLGK